MRLVRTGPIVLMLMILCGLFAPPAQAAELGREPVPNWIPVTEVPESLLAETGAAVGGVQERVAEMVTRAAGRRPAWLSVAEEAPVFTRDSSGRHGFVMALRANLILQGADVEERAARGAFDRVLYLRVSASEETGIWGTPDVRLMENPAIPVPAFPEGGPSGRAERVRGWRLTYEGEQPTAPVGAGISLADAEQLVPLAAQLLTYPPTAILGQDPLDANLVMATGFNLQGVVRAGGESESILVIRTVNAYQRADWMEPLFGQADLAEVMLMLDAAAREAGVAPTVTATQRVLLQRTAEGWQVSEVRIIPGPYELTVEEPAIGDRFVGLLGMLGVRVPAGLRQAEPVPVATDAAATVGSTLVLALWAGAQAASMASLRGGGALARRLQAGDNRSKLAKLGADAMDWLFKPLEKPLSKLMQMLGRRIGLFKHLTEDEDDEASGPPAVYVAPTQSGVLGCSHCGTPVMQNWAHCTACGCQLLHAPAADVAAGGDQ